MYLNYLDRLNKYYSRKLQSPGKWKSGVDRVGHMDAGDPRVHNARENIGPRGAKLHTSRSTLRSRPRQGA